MNQTTTKIYKNNHNSTFTEINPGIEGADYGSITWVDYDGDGSADILINGAKDNSYQGKTLLYHNDGSDQFSSSGASLTACMKGRASWGDFDQDGDLDLLLAGQEDSRVLTKFTKLFRNNAVSSPITDPTPVAGPLPDLQISRINAPASCARGRSCPIEVTVKNAGTTAGPATRLTLYLSRDKQLIPGSDQKFKDFKFPAVAAGRSVKKSIPALLAKKLPAGRFFICAYIDSLRAATETNEDNNTRCYTKALRLR